MNDADESKRIERPKAAAEVAVHEALDFLEDMLESMRRVADSADVRQDVRDDLRAVHDKVRGLIRN